MEIDRLQRSCASDSRVLGLAGGLPAPELFPAAELAEAFVELSKRGAGRALQYGWPEGDVGLRAWIAGRLRRRGANVSDEDVIVTCGAQQAIALAAETIVRAGYARRVEVDDLTYPAALDLFATKEIAAVKKGDGAFAYVMPGVANPRGDAMSRDAKRALLARDLPIIADEAYAELRFDGRVDAPLVADAPDRVFLVGSFSKTLCPGLRVGYLVAPRAHHRVVMELKHSADLQAASLTQAVLAVHLGDGAFDAHLACARKFYARRAERLFDEVRRRFPRFRVTKPLGGFSLWVETDIEGDDARLLAIAAEHGTSFDPGRQFRASNAAAPIALRLCYSSLPEPDLTIAAARLERAVRAYETELASSRAPAVERAA